MKSGARVLRRFRAWARASLSSASLIAAIGQAAELPAECEELTAHAQIVVSTGHPWRPPFGIERVGAMPVASVQLDAPQALRDQYFLVIYRRGQEIERHALSLQKSPRVSKREVGIGPFFANVQLKAIPTEAALHARCAEGGGQIELRRQTVEWPEIEAEAVARAERPANPVDLGAILPPHDWLLLAAGQTALVEVAALARAGERRGVHLRVWFEGGGEGVELDVSLPRNRRVVKEVKLRAPEDRERSTLHVRLSEGDRELWSKAVRTMIVREPLELPVFGAIETTLRYDAPIAVYGSKTEAPLAPIDYETAWDAALNDVVVALPNGERFIFWRGSSYVPFWAGRENTGLAYQWAENLGRVVTHPDGYQDLPEPLFDRELRYGRVRIVESTASRVRVQWSYQSTDIDYNVWGDQAVEEFIFYPDGFGTRVLTLATTVEGWYQLSEFIILMPQAAYPFEVLPRHMMEVLFLDGEKRRIEFPVEPYQVPGQVPKVTQPRQLPMVARVFQEKGDCVPAIYFDPENTDTPMSFKAFHDKGELVTPTYWGSHWPLNRGAWTHWSIDEGIHAGPSHSSVAGWIILKEEGDKDVWESRPILREDVSMPDALGRTRRTAVRRWAWLIGKSEASDGELLARAHSFMEPPALEVKGARIAVPSYSRERRALRLIAESLRVEVRVKPVRHTVNPVFEIEGAPREIVSVTLDERVLGVGDYAWDGSTLWIRASIDARGATISISFRGSAF